jgi:uncharacterized protein YjbI with pentapeptide repeats
MLECGPKLVANLEHLDLLRQGVEVWNAGRAGLRVRDLRAAIRGVENRSAKDLRAAIRRMANLSGIDLSNADLTGVDLVGANLFGADLRGTDLSRADLFQANLIGANLSQAILVGADLTGADLVGADLSRANMIEANLLGAVLSLADLTGADLSGANLMAAQLVQARLEDATLTGCKIHGVSAWNVELSKGTKQHGLIITPEDESAVTVDDLEVAQFVYLLLHNEKIRRVIDTVTSKVVLILGRFTPDRKAVLDAIREELRRRAYVPILFDFDVPAERDITETVSLLARMARFIVADLTDPSSIPKELEAIVPHLAVPVQPLLEGDRPYAMFKDYWKYDWVLPVHRYEGLPSLRGTLAEKVIGPAETKMNDLADKRRRFEAELIQPR